MAYCTVTQVKAYIDPDGQMGSGDDSLLSDLIDRAQKYIETATGRVFEVSAASERYFDALQDVDGRVLYLDYDLAAITSVTNGDGNTVSSNDYVTEPRNSTPYYALRLKTSTTTYWTYNDTPENAITVNGHWGYSQSPPADITQACIRLAAAMYRGRDVAGDALDGATVSAEGIVIRPGAIPRYVSAVIRQYRRYT